MYKTPYHMSISELTELKMQLQELLDKVIFDQVCHHGGCCTICKENGWYVVAMYQL